MNITTDTFIDVAKENNCIPRATLDALLALNPSYKCNVTQIKNRIANYRRKGLLPLDSGNYVSTGEFLKGSSTLYGPDGEIKSQWIKTDVGKEQALEDFKSALKELASELPKVPEITEPVKVVKEDLATVYVSNDIHFGLLTWDEETRVNWDTKKAVQTMEKAYDYLFDCSPDSEIGIVVDLGDLTEADDFTNLTPHGKNPLDTDSRYPKVLKAAYQSLRYAITKALQKHKTVYFYNIAGNHDVSSGHAVREVISAIFEDNPRVIICNSPTPIKYHQHGKTLLGFAHGDGLKFNRAGETMAIDNQDIFSSTEHRFFHFGHTHVDAVKDGAICRCESHRNIAPLNHWAYHKGFRRGCGTMKSITYSKDNGEVSRNIFNVTP